MVTFFAGILLYLVIGMIWAWIVVPAIMPDFYAYLPVAGQVSPNSAKYTTVLVWLPMAIVTLLSLFSDGLKSRKRRWGPLTMFNQWLNRKLNVYEVD